MTRHASSARTTRLPDVVPLFPLSGALLLPFGRLPLNIFEPRYINMVEHALRCERIIGMVQPRNPKGGGAQEEIFSVGGAGRIVSFVETFDGRMEIMLEGLSRFKIGEELPLLEGFRRAKVEWKDFGMDRQAQDEPFLDRRRLKSVLSEFFRINNIQMDWRVLSVAPDDGLVASLAMACPFAPNEKQAILESPTPRERAQTLIALIEMAVLEEGCASGRHQ